MVQTLESLRAEVDAANLKILDALNERLRLVEAIRRIKEKSSSRLYSPEREAEMLDQLMLANRGPISADELRSLFKEIFKLSLDHMKADTRMQLHVHRAEGDEDRVYEVRGHRLGEGPQLIAGPCSVESVEQCELVAARLAALGVGFLRGGAFKPRTSPYSFQGLGEAGLKMLREVADRHDMAVVTEILDTRHFDLVERYTDVFQVGTRNMYNYELLKLLGQADRPVLLKRGFMATLEEFLLAAEYVAKEGNQRIVLCERGIRTHERWTRNTLDLSAIPLLRMATPFPVVVDISHGTGRTDIMVPMARAALAAGAQGLMVEVHPSPALALSDNAQQLDLEQVDAFYAAVFNGMSGSS
ncbi:MAG TPA: 3-deoxy-7-phosphoheptulonate synthase [Deltaproteobacteria bacterium]|nr:3-deoxy-7-phosphoheptulonate synthase [Deltaproteobacteria bacterium]HCP46274.1 3-deoxy-7-phosphoheptulonate synthase [Deltaproteobacteria bacterium]